MAFLRRTPSQMPESKAATAAVIIFPLAMAWAYLLALGEKLHDSFYGSTNRPSFPSPSSERTERVSRGDRGHQHRGEVYSPDVRRTDDGEEKQKQPQQRRQQQKRYLNRLEFSLGDFLRSKVHDPFSTTSSRGSHRASAQHQSREAAFTASSGDKSFAPTVATPPASSSSSSSHWPFCLRLGSSSGSARNKQHTNCCCRGLPPASRPRATDKTLVLDLDETLIHAREELTGDGRFDFMVVLPPRCQSQKLRGLSLCHGRPKTDGASGTAAAASGSGGCSADLARNSSGRLSGARDRRIYVRKRPHLREFLEAVSQQFEVVLFTAARGEFARAVLDEIDPERDLIDHVLSRENCTRVNTDSAVGTRYREMRWAGKSSSSNNNNSSGNSSKKRSTAVVKDLGIIGRPLSKVIMVENSWDSIRYHLENGVHISSFYGDREDTGLLSTLSSLDALAPAADVRDGIIRLYVQAQARKEGHTLLPDALPEVPTRSSSSSTRRR